MVNDIEKIEQIEAEVQALREEVQHLKQHPRKAMHAHQRVVRKRSEGTLFGMPIYDIALGPDLEKGELRGHARGFFAIGDIATGVFALGGIARGVFALGGIALGFFAFGGLSVGLLLAMGGAAIGSLAVGGAAVGLVAIGGAAVGVVAIGGAAYGYYAWGDAAGGQFIISKFKHDQQAMEFFSRWVPGFGNRVGPPPR